MLAFWPWEYLSQNHGPAYFSRAGFANLGCFAGPADRCLRSPQRGDGGGVRLRPQCMPEDALSSACADHLLPHFKLIGKFRKKKNNQVFSWVICTQKKGAK